MAKTVKRVLVANRGEIALRIIRGCREEGVETVAVYSDADRTAPHVRAADRAVHIGGNLPSESYLRIDRLIEAAKETGADSVHPGYGFLAERQDFSAAVAEAGLTFLGPPASAIAAMGDKTAARRRMQEAGVPVVPGTVEPLDSAAAVAKVAKSIGYPILLKAAAGGGGRGMRVVRAEAELAAAFTAAQGEALKAFGDGRVYCERFLEGPKHVEIQVLADTHGHVVHFGERECSTQRRHQKLIEEAPSPAVTPELRAAMGDAAVRAAAAVGYVSAGTCEFLLLPNKEFYFLEMNTRLQVEHPVTELVYGVDLVRQQIRIGRGEHIAVARQPLTPRGWAIECRITAEDPFADFLPAGGKVTEMRVPTGPGVRWDGWVEQGSEVPLFYDSLLGKLITWAEDRDLCIRRMRRALQDLVIVGVPTSREFHLRMMHDPDFCGGRIDIGWWDRQGKALMTAAAPDRMVQDAAVAAALLEHARRGVRTPTAGAGSPTGAGQAATPSYGSAWLDVARREALR